MFATMLPVGPTRCASPLPAPIPERRVNDQPRFQPPHDNDRSDDRLPHAPERDLKSLIEQPEDLGSLPLAGLADDDRTWELPQPFPTSLVGLWPGETMPTPDEVTQAFARFVGEAVAVHEEIEPEDGAIEWNRVLSVPGLHAPVIVWVERARSFGPDDLPDARLAATTWVLGCESLLSEQAPLDDFIALMRLLAGAMEEIPAVLDAMTRQWFRREEIEALFLADEPAATEEILWRIHAVGRAAEIHAESPVWLYTVGLWRCGKPELEMLEVPGRFVEIAVTLMNGIAALAIAGPLPRPSVVASIGENLRVAFRPWQDVAQYLDANAVGSEADRRHAEEPGALNPLTGVRAVICDPAPKGTYRSVWSWPEAALRLIEDGRGALYLSERSTLQLARMARLTWPEFATAFASIDRAVDDASERGEHRHVPAFLVKAAFADARDPERGREHLWFEIRSLRGDRVSAELLNTPQLATHLRPGDVVAIERDSVTEWRVMLPNGGFGPHNAHELLQAIDRYRSQQ